jgi:hypothetical protein
MSLKALAFIILTALVITGLADEDHYEDDVDRTISNYHCESDEFVLKLSDAACTESRRRSVHDDEYETETESQEDYGDEKEQDQDDDDDSADCESSIKIKIKSINAAAVVEVKRELETGETESESRLQASWVGAGVFTCNTTSCTEVPSACRQEITSWRFTCPDSQPSSGMFELVVSSIPADAVTLVASFTTNTTGSQLPSEVEILVSGNASLLGCTLGPGELFCLSVEVDTDCEREMDDSGTDSEAVGCGAVSFAWATTDSTGTPILTKTNGNNLLFCVGTDTIVNWDPTIISLGSSGSLIATTLALFGLVV